MASKNFSGILRDPLGTLASNDKYRFTHVSTTGEVIRGSTSYLNIGDDGVYNIDIEYGNVTIESYSELGKRWINQGTTTINADTVVTTLPALLNALVPASDTLLIELQTLLNDAEQAASIAEQASIEAQASALVATGAVDYSSAIWESVPDEMSAGGIVSGVTPVHKAMRRCLLNDDGIVNYYLDENNSNLKFDGTASDLTGGDGQVMVEIPKCYVKSSTIQGGSNPIVEWSVSSAPKLGYVLHPAFTKDGTLQYDNKLDMWYYVGVTQEVDYVYVGAYQASVFDVSESAYIDGLNSDDNAGRVDVGADKLSSVSGKYPMVGLTRSEFRSIASNRGAGWGEIDFWTHSLLQLLYTTEYRNLNSQAAIGQGATNVSGGYPSPSDIQVDSPHSNAGKSNSIGNQSGGVDSTVRDVPWMSYRGIENFWGNCYVWIDGVNVLDQVYHVNNTGIFADDTVGSGYTQLGLQAPSDDGYIRNVQNNTLGFIPSSVARGASNIAFSDQYHQYTGYRVMAGSGHADMRAQAGAFTLNASRSSSSSVRNRDAGGRVVYKGGA